MEQIPEITKEALLSFGTFILNKSPHDNSPVEDMLYRWQVIFWPLKSTIMEQKPENKTCPLCNKSMLQQSFDPLTTTLKWADNEITCHQHCIIDLVLKRIESAPTNKPEAPMSWEDALYIASKGQINLAISTALFEKLYPRTAEIYIKAAELYAEAAFHRETREQREMLVRKLKKQLQELPTYSDAHSMLEALIEYYSDPVAPAPEFKTNP